MTGHCLARCYSLNFQDFCFGSVSLCCPVGLELLGSGNPSASACIQAAAKEHATRSRLAWLFDYEDEFTCRINFFLRQQIPIQVSLSNAGPALLLRIRWVCGAGMEARTPHVCFLASKYELAATHVQISPLMVCFITVLF